MRRRRAARRSERPRRRWAPERFAAAADRLARAGARPVLVGSAVDLPVSSAVRECATTAVYDLTGRTDLGTLAAVFACCAAVVGNDSGPLHLARAVGAATVGCTGAATRSTPRRRCAPGTGRC
jgi:ADP-heptose:LPS heptosyltransferase